MREIRTSGSEGGETGQPVFPTPIDFGMDWLGHSCVSFVIFHDARMAVSPIAAPPVAFQRPNPLGVGPRRHAAVLIGLR